MSSLLDDIEEQIKKDTKESGKEVDLKISKKTRDLLKILKIVLSKPKYDDVILFLILYYKQNKILKTQSTS